MPKFEEWPEHEIYWKNLKFAWSLSSDLIPGYRLKERDRVKMIAFNFRMAYMYNKKVKNILKALALKTVRNISRIRYESRFFFCSHRVAYIPEAVLQEIEARVAAELTIRFALHRNRFI